MSVTLSAPPTPAAVTTPASPLAGRATGRTLAAAVARACDEVVHLPPGDTRWAVVGPLLTAFVDATRRRAGLSGSPVAVHEQVPPALRLRDLGRLAQATVTSGAVTSSSAEVDDRLRSLQVAVGRGLSGA